MSKKPTAVVQTPGAALQAQKQVLDEKCLKSLTKHCLEPLQQEILAAARPCIWGKTKKIKMPTKADNLSRIGGLPALPAKTAWPMDTKPKKPRPLKFAAQVNCAEIAPFDFQGLLPDSGLLSFFADPDRGSANSGKVLYTPAGAQLELLEAPDSIKDSLYVSKQLKFEMGLTFPSTEMMKDNRLLRRGSPARLPRLWKSYPNEVLTRSFLDYIEEAYCEFREEFVSTQFQLMGYPASSYPGWPDAEDLQVLLQIAFPEPEDDDEYDSDADSEGVVYFHCSPAQLNNRQFQAVVGNSAQYG